MDIEDNSCIMGDDEFIDYVEGDIDEDKHAKLIENVLSLNKVQHLRKPSRTEPTIHRSEYNLIKSVTGEKGSVNLNDLTKVIKKGKNYVDVKRRIEKSGKETRLLPKPLEKPQAERIRRGLSYLKTKQDLDKWEPVITSNRVSAALTFPLDHNPKLEVLEDRNATKNWRFKSKLQEQLEMIEPKIEIYNVTTNKEDAEVFPISLAEMKEKRREMSKIRAIQSYKEAKSRRLSKIKSKKYHRIQRREKIKEQLKEFEQLQKTNPEEALKKLDEIEKVRAEERFSLRHRSTGKWAKNKQIRAKYDKESRQALAQQLSLSRELVQKQLITSNSEDEDNEEIVIPIKDSKNASSNPWQNGTKTSSEVETFVKSYENFYNNSKALQNPQEQTINNDTPGEESSDDEYLSASEMVSNIDKKLGEKSSADCTTVAKIDVQKTFINKKNCDQIKSATDIKVGMKKASINSKQSEKINKIQRKKNKNIVQLCNNSSDWKVEAFECDNNKNNLEIDYLFDKLDNKLDSRIKKSMKSIEKDKTFQIHKKEKVENKLEKTVAFRANPEHVLAKKPFIDEPLSEELMNSENNEIKNNRSAESLSADRKLKLLSLIEKGTLHTAKKNASEVKLNANKIITAKKIKLSTALADIIQAEYDENSEDESSHIQTVEAYQDNELEKEFKMEKVDEIENDKPKDIDITLPGWGSWGGPNMHISKRKRRRFLIKVPKVMPRRDDNKGNLVINERAANKSKIAEHMVKEIPFPFNSVKDFEASIRAPIGSTFIPEKAFKKLIKPAIQTQMGTIITPMSRDILLNKHKQCK